MENKFCHSCGISLSIPDMQGKAENYCTYCSDEKGELKSKEVVFAGVKDWLLSWQPNIDEDTANKRTESYLKAMPAWAE